jgi:isoquinoline 1-oxidoreductase beta subunit
MNCTVRVSADGCEVWCGTQSPQNAQRAAAGVLQIPQERVTVHTTYLGGGFGRRGEADYVTQATTAAKASGRPVKLIWSREEDLQHDFYRPAAIASAADSMPLASSTRSKPAWLPRQLRTSVSRTRRSTLAGVGDMAYEIPNLRVHRPEQGYRRAFRLLALGQPIAQSVHGGRVPR